MSEHARKRARAVLRGRDDGNIILLPDRSFIGWYRHITLVLVALAYLTGICATERFSTSPPAPSGPPARPARPRSAPSACTAHLALFFICLPGSGLVMVASLPPEPGLLLSYETPSEGWLILAGSQRTAPGFVLDSIHFPDIQEISGKCRSSRKSVRVLSPIYSFHERSSERMTLLPVADGARLLGIHPKTLCHWLKEAHVPLATHPADARIKCVTEEHLQQVASLHGRPLQSSVPSQAQALSGPEKEREPASVGCSLPLSHLHETDQIQRLASLVGQLPTPVRL